MSLRRTPLYDAHLRAGAKMVEFAGWEMPVQYTSVLEEHHAVRNDAGLFDVSHMGVFVFEGPGALEDCNRLITNDLGRIENGRALYTVVVDDEGKVIDDVICYRFSPERILVVVNAANRETDFSWFRSKGAELRDDSDRWALLALQGPRAQSLLQPLASVDLATIRYFRFAEAHLAGKPAIVARTGYTGEDGFELFCRPEDAEALWTALVQAGARPCGLGARDTLRLEAAFCLYGNELTREYTPFEAGLDWVVKLDKNDFVGKEALLRQRAEGVNRKLVGFTLEDRGIPRGGYPVLHDGREVGVVTSGTMSPTLKKPIGLAYVPAELASVGSTFEVKIRDKAAKARVIETPFYRRSR
ncbi:MAG: glycine cleavage system aminomethyltransferase GcvT [Pseudomonadota bacterium]|nr:MAG: glycine cleavage system aminomethyltransferase GcvT [Pseudomonadota bacterium]